MKTEVPLRVSRAFAFGGPSPARASHGRPLPEGEVNDRTSQRTRRLWPGPRKPCQPEIPVKKNQGADREEVLYKKILRNRERCTRFPLATAKNVQDSGLWRPELYNIMPRRHPSCTKPSAPWCPWPLRGLPHRSCEQGAQGRGVDRLNVHRDRRGPRRGCRPESRADPAARLAGTGDAAGLAPGVGAPPGRAG